MRIMKREKVTKMASQRLRSHRQTTKQQQHNRRWHRDKCSPAQIVHTIRKNSLGFKFEKCWLSGMQWSESWIMMWGYHMKMHWTDWSKKAHSESSFRRNAAIQRILRPVQTIFVFVPFFGFLRNCSPFFRGDDLNWFLFIPLCFLIFLVSFVCFTF